MNELDKMLTPTLHLSLDAIDQNVIRVTGSTPVHKERLASIPGSRFNGKGNYWKVPRRWATLKIMTRLFGEFLSWGDDVLDFANEMWTNIVEPSLMLRNEGAKPEWIEAISAMCPADRQPRDYQVAGAMFLPTARRAMLLDDQGTGKMTQTALSFMLYPETLPALVVAPASVIYTWEKELAKFGIKALVVDSSESADKRRKALDGFEESDATVVVTTYSMVTKHSRVLGYGTIKLTDDQKATKELNHIGWATVVADEAHRIKDPTTVQTRAMWGVSQFAPYRWATTGTPTESDIMDYWPVLHFIDPVEYPSKVKFMDLWVLSYPDYFGGTEIVGLRPDTQEEFYACTDWHWRRVLKTDLPPKVTVTYEAFLSAKERNTYDKLDKQLMAEIGGNSYNFDVLFASNHMVKAGRLMQAASATLEFDENDDVRMVEPSAKLNLLEEVLENPLYADKPTILWFRNRDLLALQEARFDKKETKYVSIHGGIVGRDRERAMEAFQDGEVDYILCTISAASEGVTLTRAPQAIFVQREHSFLKQTQAPDRNHRIGSEIHDEITYIILITHNTVEGPLTEYLAEKAANMQELVRDGVL